MHAVSIFLFISEHITLMLEVFLFHGVLSLIFIEKTNTR